MNAATYDLSGRNRRVGLYALLGALAMLGLGYAAVPLYRLFCQVTGLGGTTQRVSAETAAAVKVSAVSISVRFDANVDRNMPWHFQPDQVTQTVRLGARSLASYTSRNLADRPITGRASFNVSPDAAGKYFSKIQCFCFVEQTLQPGQEVRMPVTYYVDPAILQDPEAKAIKQITLSYTFHEDKAPASAAAARPAAPGRQTSAHEALKPLDRPANAR